MATSVSHHRFVFLLSAAYRRVQQQARRDGEPGAARSGLLLAVSPQPGGTRTADVARALDLGASGLSGLIDRAIEQGLVTREDDPDDGRAWRLALTARGHAARAAAIERAHAMNARMCEGFAASELDIVARWLEAVRNRFFEEET